MIPRKLNHSTLKAIRELIEANFAGRDELYAAVETLDDDARRNICVRLAEHLAGHAAELSQILLANGRSEYKLSEVEFIDYLAERTFLEMVKDVHGETRVLASIEQCERNLKEKYDRMLTSIPEAEIAGILQHQRGEVEFGEQVLHTMKKATRNDNEDTDPE
jgi:hypothetical protein